MIVSDASPIIAFAKYDGGDLLFRACPKILIPTAVQHELILKNPTAPGIAEIKSAMAAKKLLVSPVLNSGFARQLQQTLDDGEAEAIALAVEKPDSILLIEDGKGRAAAAALGLTYMGNLGVLALAKKVGLISKARPIAEALSRLGTHWSATVLRTFFSQMGE